MKAVKRHIAMMLIVIMCMAPISARAMEPMSIELVDYDSDGDILSSDTTAHTIEWWTVAYKPAEVRIEKQTHAIAVYADMTTAARNVVVQYSRDPQFKRAVTTKTFRNVNYQGPVLAFLASDGGRVGNNWYYTDTVIVKQAGKTLHSRRKQVGEWSRLSITQADINASRKKARSLTRMYIPGLKCPRGIYVRVRSVYEGNHYRTVYSGWSRTILVR